MKSEFSFTNNEFKLNNRYKNMNIYEYLNLKNQKYSIYV